MIDNWKGDGGWQPEIMEGPHGGGRIMPWAEIGWPERMGRITGWTFAAACCVGLVLLIAYCDPGAERKAKLEACQKAAPTPYEYFKCK